MTIAMDPPGILAAGNVRLWWVASLTNPTSPAVAELAAGCDLTFELYELRPALDEDQFDDSPICGASTCTDTGRTTLSLGTVEYDYNPQNPTDPQFPAYSMLLPGGTGWLVERRGLPAATAAATGQWVDVYPARTGARGRVPIDGEDGAALRVSQRLHPHGAPLYDRQLS